MKASNGRGHQINHRLTPSTSRLQRYPSRIPIDAMRRRVDTRYLFVRAGCVTRSYVYVWRISLGRTIKYKNLVRDVTILQRKRQVPSLGKEKRLSSFRVGRTEYLVHVGQLSLASFAQALCRFYWPVSETLHHDDTRRQD